MSHPARRHAKGKSADASIESYRRTRAWVQRISDSRIFSGWIAELSKTAAILDIPAAQDLSPGDECSIQALGTASCAVVKGKVQLVAAHQVSFALEGSARFLKSGEEARMRASGLLAMVSDEYAPIETEIIDISPNGLGMLASVPFERGSEIQLALATPAGQIYVSGEVRYCRQMSNEPIRFRVGVRLKRFDRVNQARWNRLIEGMGA
jgi:hypothetical protein